MDDKISDKEIIREIVTSVSQLQDMKQWERLEEYFVKKPFIDNKALSGETPAVIPKVVRMVSSRRAKVSTSVEHLHYVADRGDRYVWTVKGTIDYILVKTSTGSWKISQMIFKMTDQAVRPIGAAA
jgi:hypothetical protein